MNIDRDFLGMALTNHTGYRTFFDRETGDVVVDESFSTKWDEARYIEIVPLPSAESYDFRAEFAASIANAELRSTVEHALQGGRGAFRRFLDTVRDHPELEARWFKAEAQWLDGRVTEWLAEHGIGPGR